LRACRSFAFLDETKEKRRGEIQLLTPSFLVLFCGEKSTNKSFQKKDLERRKKAYM